MSIKNTGQFPHTQHYYPDTIQSLPSIADIGDKSFIFVNGVKTPYIFTHTGWIVDTPDPIEVTDTVGLKPSDLNLDVNNNVSVNIENVPKVTNDNLDISLTTHKNSIIGVSSKTLTDIVSKLDELKTEIDLIKNTDGIKKITDGIVNKNTAGTEIFTDANAGSVKLTGSLPSGINKIGSVNTSKDEYEFGKITAKTAHPINHKFVKPVTSVVLTNFGSDIAKCSLNGYPAIPTIHDNLDATKWTFTGTWLSGATYYLYGTNAQYSDIVGDIAVYNPGVSVKMLGVAFVPSASAGIAKIELSTDGATWQDPSNIVGAVRSDGTIGADMDIIDTYHDTYEITTKTMILSYILPNNIWQVKITVTPNKNALSTDNKIFIDAGMIGDATKGFDLKPGETKTLPVYCTSVSIGCTSGAPEVSIEGYR